MSARNIEPRCEVVIRGCRNYIRYSPAAAFSEAAMARSEYPAGTSVEVLTG